MPNNRYVFRPRSARVAQAVMARVRSHLTAALKLPEARPESVYIVRKWLRSPDTKPQHLPLTWWMSDDTWKHVSRAARNWHPTNTPYAYLQLLQARRNGRRIDSTERRRVLRAEREQQMRVITREAADEYVAAFGSIKPHANRGEARERRLSPIKNLRKEMRRFDSIVAAGEVTWDHYYNFKRAMQQAPREYLLDTEFCEWVNKNRTALSKFTSTTITSHTV